MESILSGAPVAKTPGFWARQFSPNRTAAQDGFDVTFGLVLPIVCFVVDPIVFKSFPILGPALLEDYQLLAYLVSVVEMGFFLVWRTFPAKAAAFSPLFAGVLLAGAIFSAVIGFAILPVSLMALLFVIGLLGFMPFVTAFVYLRNGVRAIKANNSPLFWRLTAAAVSGVLVMGLLVSATLYAEKSISGSLDTVIYGNVIEAEAAANRLKRFRFIPLKHSNRLALAYGREWNEEKKAVLKRAYEEITGGDVEFEYRRMLMSD